jgi:hypothetical protein
MTIYRLIHTKQLGYTAVTKKTAPALPDAVFAMAAAGAVVVTFRPLDGRRPKRLIKKVNATDRFSWIKAKELVLYGLENDSPLAPLILWDVAHAAAIGSRIIVMANAIEQSYLQRAYFAEGLKVVESAPQKLVFEKIAMLGAERDAGLDAWTFGIPVGPEDATLLNATVKRILEIDVPQKEILLCGRPGANFLYLDQVRIVGEDITAPPVKICAKKNRLAEEAQYPNLCIIHDRVFLPQDFYAAMKRYGDCYPMSTLQSVYFDDKYNFIPRRYSDYGVSHRVRAASVKGLLRGNDVDNASEFSPSILAKTEFSGFYPAHAMRYSTSVYATGSMYICKRAVWLAYPQNENIYWIEFEDLEHGFRMSDNGVPSRVNPHAVSQSLISRPLLSRAIGTFIENVKGQNRLFTSWTEMVRLPRKPAIKLSHEGALASMNRFAQKYVPKHVFNQIPVASVFRTNTRMSSILDIITRASVPYQVDAVARFLADFEKDIVFDQMPFYWREMIASDMLNGRGNLTYSMVLNNDALVNHAALRPKHAIFYRTLHDYLQPRSVFGKLGTFMSALYLFAKRKNVIYLKGGPWAYYRALSKSTPYVDYGN